MSQVADLKVGGVIVAVLKTILMVVFIIISLIITVVILMQEGKSAGLGAISGAADTYWGKNKGRSMEGMLVKLTRVCVILFLVLAVVLDLGIW
jgi:preprotein translocase subunit SecG